jgi:hypothetical protein
MRPSLVLPVHEDRECPHLDQVLRHQAEDRLIGVEMPTFPETKTADRVSVTSRTANTTERRPVTDGTPRGRLFPGCTAPQSTRLGRRQQPLAPESKCSAPDRGC